MQAKTETCTKTFAKMELNFLQAVEKMTGNITRVKDTWHNMRKTSPNITQKKSLIAHLPYTDKENSYLFKLIREFFIVP